MYQNISLKRVNLGALPLRGPRTVISWPDIRNFLPHEVPWRGTWHAKTDFSHQQAPKCYFLNFDM